MMSKPIGQDSSLNISLPMLIQAVGFIGAMVWGYGQLNTRITGAVKETYASTLTTDITGAVTETYSSTQATTATGEITIVGSKVNLNP